MNVIVSNKQKSILDNANIDAIKDLTGLFNVDDLIAKFKNYFFSKMILDVTSVENFTSREVLQKLVSGIGSDRLILLLPQTPPPPDEFKKMLIDLKIYNFSNEISDVVKFIDNPNTYETVMRGMDNEFYNNSEYVDNSIKGVDNSDNSDSVENTISNNSFNSSASLQDALDSFNIRDNSDNNNTDNVNTTINNDDSYIPATFDNFNGDIENAGNSDNSIQETSSIDESFDMPNINDLYDIKSDNNSSPTNLNDLYNLSSENNSNNLSSGDESFYDMSSNSNTVSEEEKNREQNKSGNKFLNIDSLNSMGSDGKIVIGFKNITEHAGSTSLIYMLLKELCNKKMDVLAIEINRDDFRLFVNNRMVKILEKDIKEFLSSRYERIVLVDLNDCVDTSFCDQVIYLLEPSTIMLNKLMLSNKDIFKQLEGQKIVLNKSMLSPEDVNILSNEAGIKFMYNIKALNDRINNSEIDNFIDILGIK